MERNDNIRGNRNLNWWERIPELMEAGDKFRGSECRNCSPRQHSAVQQSLQRAASAIPACCIRLRSALASSTAPSVNGSTAHRHHHYTSPITKGRQTNIPEKAPCTNDRSNGSPRSQLARCSVMRTSGQLVILSGFNYGYVLSAFLCVSASISTGSGRL